LLPARPGYAAQARRSSVYHGPLMTERAVPTATGYIPFDRCGYPWGVGEACVGDELHVLQMQAQLHLRRPMGRRAGAASMAASGVVQNRRRYWWRTGTCPGGFHDDGGALIGRIGSRAVYGCTRSDGCGGDGARQGCQTRGAASVAAGVDWPWTRTRAAEQAGSLFGSSVLLEKCRAHGCTVKKRKTVARPGSGWRPAAKGRCNALQEGEEPTWMPATGTECIRRPTRRLHDDGH
jgi:hypothetical protein